MTTPTDPSPAELYRGIERVERAVRDGHQATNERLGQMVTRELFKETVERLHQRSDQHDAAIRDEETERKADVMAIRRDMNINMDKLGVWVRWLGGVSVTLLGTLVAVLSGIFG